MTVIARTADVLVETVEDPRRRFVPGVQWHPEDLADRPVHLALFKALVEAGAGQSVPRRRI